MKAVLPYINSPEDLKKLSYNEINALIPEIREFLIKNVLKTGGHLASNLGVVELTLALHRVFNAPADDIIWDVGHQCYVHKMITGRLEMFSTLRQKNGLSGFPKTSESIYDTFETGHSSTSLSIANGFAMAKRLSGDNGQVIAVVGDASFSGGPSMEALNCISQTKQKVIIILNDNQMSIGKNMGAVAKYLNRVRTKPSYYNIKQNTESFLDKIPLIGKGTKKIVRKLKGTIKYMITPGILFEQLGYKYFGPVDGHDIKALEEAFSQAKKINNPVIVHVCTTKGKGYENAEKFPDEYHGVSASTTKGKTFTNQLGETMLSLAAENEKVVSVCPSMVKSCGLYGFYEKYPERAFDVGIAESHAVIFAAAMSKKGYIPVVSVYSSFLQRAYDSILHDVALGCRHVVFAIDRSGVVGADGETHQGIYDISFLSHIPGLIILAPSDCRELDYMLRYAVNEAKCPVAIRFPKGTYPDINTSDKISAEVIRPGKYVTLAALGRMVHTALDVADKLSEEGMCAEVITLKSAKPLDFKTLVSSAEKTGYVAVLEDNIKSGGVGKAVAAYFAENKINIMFDSFAFPDTFIPQGKCSELFADYCLDAGSICNKIKERKKYENKA